MSSDTVKSTQTGVGFLGLLTLLFIAAKLWGAITWSWIWVLSPLWLPFALVIAIVLIIVLVAVLIALGGAVADTLRRK